MKKRLDVLMFEKGLVESRSKAQALVMAGTVLVNDKKIIKAGTQVSDDDIIEIEKQNPYVSRGGLKLESVLNLFDIDFTDKICMDIGASTGGFTDCMLQHGAQKVYAVDVGSGQLHYKLRQDVRVVNIENVNFRYFDKTLLKDEIDLITIDVSFISLDKILTLANEILSDMGSIIAMIKPQFELEYGEIKKGVVKDEKLRIKAIDKIKKFAIHLGLDIIKEQDSAVKGPKGNLEHFILLNKKVG
ncbi:MAG: TlyA family RNA methyltransferase [Endomicrobiaceae bacterium]|nr:TlyA family RNA methyltransferase [Endomicrobiaceae bacterium]MDD3053548.1 TlyA family RNA methyltransferase [Endomicrobiaceae bacterium]MDD3922347.1 TlyA family RNA methyltransferase [Endomicrobiaceae bacterium]